MIPIKTDIQSSSPDKDESLWQNPKSLLFLTVILFLTFLAFLPSLQNGFVNWDDQVNVYQNPNIIEITNWGTFYTNIKSIFTTDVMGNYNPLPIFSFAIEHWLYGLKHPEWMHLNNILLHLFCVFLVFRISLALGLTLLPAAFCALLFGIHPLRVESVAWITERKDVLMGAFYFLALYFYVKAVRSSFQTKYFWLVITCFVLALLSKIQAVSLPLSMLLVDYYFGRKISLKLITEKWHYFALSLLTGMIGIYFLRADGGIQNNSLFPFSERLFIGAYSYTVYLIKSIIPYQSVPVYPYPTTIGWVFKVSLIPVVFIMGLIVYFYRKGEKVLVFGLLFFTVNIMFLLQILGAGQGFIADRFTYIAYFGLFFIFAFGFQWILEKRESWKLFTYIVAMIILAVYGYLTLAQNRIWKNGETLWTHVLKHYPKTALAWANRGSYFEEQEQLEEAFHDYSQAIFLQPNNPITFFSRGNLYLHSTEPEKLRSALRDFSRAIELSPRTSSYLINRGIVFLSLENLNSALSDLNTAERITPNRADIYFIRSQIYFKLQQYERAQSDLEKYLEFNPGNASMWSNLGTVTRLNQQYQKSIEAFGKAIQIDSDNLEYLYKHAITAYEMGDLQQAQQDLQKLKSRGFKSINPDFEKLIRQGL